MATWKQELRALTRVEPKTEAELEFTTIALYKDESDRGCALIAGSMAENELEKIIRTRLTHLNKEQLDELFGYKGTLGTFSAKIEVAYAFEFIDHKLRADFDRIREVRNTFAHSKTVVRFKTAQIKRACSELMSGYPDTPLEGKINYPRMVYVDTVFALIRAANLMLKRESSGHVQKIKHPLSYDEVVALRDKYPRRFLRETPPGPRLGGKRKARKAQP
jgi:hypothetical protein